MFCRRDSLPVLRTLGAPGRITPHIHVLRPAGAIARSLSRRSSNVQNRSRRFCRTSDLMVRSHALYPTELRAQCSVACASPPDSPRGWRRERDSNPRWALDPYTLSRGAPSTTRPSLRYQNPPSGRVAHRGARDSVHPCTPPFQGHRLGSSESMFKFAPGEFSRPLGHLSAIKIRRVVESHTGVRVTPYIHVLRPFRAIDSAAPSRCSNSLPANLVDHSAISPLSKSAEW